MEFIKDLPELQLRLNENPKLNCVLALCVSGSIDYLKRLEFWNSDDLECYYRAVYSIIHSPPKPFADAGFGVIDKNFSKLDTARFFGVFEVDIWLKPRPTLAPKIFTARLGWVDPPYGGPSKKSLVWFK